ncbi:MAG: hypothetical protein MZU79_04015 [Anaerotruncus sp.]|nr:hypothetical protein [Anaerotruncus sp.]
MAEATEVPVLNLAAECHLALGHPERALPLLAEIARPRSRPAGRPGPGGAGEENVSINDRSHRMKSQAQPPSSPFSSPRVRRPGLGPVPGQDQRAASSIPTGKPVEKAEVDDRLPEVRRALRYDLKTDKDGPFHPGRDHARLLHGHRQEGRLRAGFQGNPPRRRRPAEVHRDRPQVRRGRGARSPIPRPTRPSSRATSSTPSRSTPRPRPPYGEAIGLDPANWSYHLNLGLALKKAGQAERGPGRVPQGGRDQSRKLQRQQGGRRGPGQGRTASPRPRRSTKRPPA